MEIDAFPPNDSLDVVKLSIKILNLSKIPITTSYSIISEYTFSSTIQLMYCIPLSFVCLHHSNHSIVDFLFIHILITPLNSTLPRVKKTLSHNQMLPFLVHHLGISENQPSNFSINSLRNYNILLEYFLLFHHFSLCLYLHQKL